MTTDGDIWASLPVPAFVIDAADRILEVNPAAEDFFNRSARTLIGEPVWDRLAVDVPLEASLERSRREGTALFINDVDVSTGERVPVVCALQIAPLAGRPGAMLLIVSPRELAGRMAEPRTLLSAARSAIGMADMLAHEIKNPLAGITGAAQLLSMSLGPGDRELTDLILAETRRILTLVEEVEAFGDQSPPALGPVNLHDVLERARRTAELGFAAHMTFVEDYDPSLPPALADADQLMQVFLNLMRNAAEAADPSGGTIRLRTHFEHGFRLRRAGGGGHVLPLQVEITDDGPGIPPDIADSIFEPFVSGRENGTGLGLALVSKIIAAHDGWISVSSVPGRTTFRISLARARDEAGGATAARTAGATDKAEAQD